MFLGCEKRINAHVWHNERLPRNFPEVLQQTVLAFLRAVPLRRLTWSSDREAEEGEGRHTPLVLSRYCGDLPAADQSEVDR